VRESDEWDQRERGERRKEREAYFLDGAKK